jgi:hypothetical protein
VLAGPVAGETGKIPENLSYIGGADVGATRKLTFSVDYLGEHVVSASRLEQTTASGIGNTTQVADTTQAEGSYETARGALGFKWKPWSELLITGNVLQKFDHNGLHHTAVPLAGISYTFHTPFER